MRFSKLSIVVHDETTAQNEFEALGVRLREHPRGVCISTQRNWKLYNALGWLVKRRRMATSKQVEQIMGNLTFAFVGERRPQRVRFRLCWLPAEANNLAISAD